MPRCTSALTRTPSRPDLALASEDINATLIDMRCALTPVVVALLFASVAGCSSRALPAVKPPPVDPHTRLGPHRAPKEAVPRILAPPPAYGNKIVMALGEAKARL